MAPFTKAANKAIPARTITAVSREGIFSFSLAGGIIAQRVTVWEGAQAVATRCGAGRLAKTAADPLPEVPICGRAVGGSAPGSGTSSGWALRGAMRSFG